MPSTYTRQECEIRISDRLVELAGKLRSRTRLSLNDASHGLEPVMGRFLNALFGWDLHDLNLGQANQPAADLGDATRRIAIHVTNDSSAKKLRDTRYAAAKYRLGEDYDSLIVFCLAVAGAKITATFTQPEGGPLIEIWDIPRLIEEARRPTSNVTIENLRAALEVLEQETQTPEKRTKAETAGATHVSVGGDNFGVVGAGNKQEIQDSHGQQVTHHHKTSAPTYLSNDLAGIFQHNLAKYSFTLSDEVRAVITAVVAKLQRTAEEQGQIQIKAGHLFLGILEAAAAKTGGSGSLPSVSEALVKQTEYSNDSRERLHIALRVDQRKEAKNASIQQGYLWTEEIAEVWQQAGKARRIFTKQSERDQEKNKILGIHHLLASMVMMISSGKSGAESLRRAGFDPVIVANILHDYVKQTENIERQRLWKDEFFKQCAARYMRTGSLSDFSYGATKKQSALQVGDYAKVLTDFFSQTGSGECCLALFAPWGRGKSYLISETADRLKDLDYETVVFQAWKYPTTPELWVHLYETLAKRACSAPWWQKMLRTLRIGFYRHGPWPFLGALLGLAFSLYPKLHLFFETLGVAKDLLLMIGLGTFVWLIMMIFGVRRTIKQLNHKYLSITRHDEKLGLQATIGSDLCALLKGWRYQRKDTGENPNVHSGAWYTDLISLPALCYLGILWALWTGSHEWASLSVFGFLGSPLWLKVALPWAVLFVGITLPLAVRYLPSSPKRLLLVVDDLDRCPLDLLITVMESIKLLVEEPAISSRMQVAMLVEEEVFKMAVLDKYSKLRAPKDLPSDGIADPRLVRESKEKLFSVHLRLLPLTGKEADEVLQMIIHGHPSLVKQLPDERSSNEQSETAVPPALDEADESEGNSLASAIRTEPDEQIADNNVDTDLQNVNEGSETTAYAASDTKGFRRIEGPEEDALRDAIQAIVAARESDFVGPRSIRNFYLRYQLARLFLHQLNISFEPFQLAEALANALTGKKADKNHPAPMLYIVSQLS